MENSSKQSTANAYVLRKSPDFPAISPTCAPRSQVIIAQSGDVPQFICNRREGNIDLLNFLYLNFKSRILRYQRLC